jgi:hypothetical protein
MNMKKILRLLVISKSRGNGKGAKRLVGIISERDILKK